MHLRDTPRTPNGCCKAGHKPPYQVRNTITLSIALRLLKRLKRAKAWLYANINTLRSLPARYGPQIDDWLYDHNVTRRRVSHIGRNLFILAAITFYSIILVGFGVLLSPNILAALGATVRFVVQNLSAFGAWLNLSSDFATILVAEVIAILGSSIVARIFRREPRAIEPNLLFTVLPIMTDKEGVKSYRINVSNEKGETGALGCIPVVLLGDLEKRDVLDVVGAKTTAATFEENIEAELLWLSNRSKQTTLRSGENDDVELLRLVPAKNGVEAHFEVPSSDSKWQSVICLKLRTFYIRLRVVSVNARHATQDFTLGYRQGEWGLL